MDLLGKNIVIRIDSLVDSFSHGCERQLGIGLLSAIRRILIVYIHLLKMAKIQVEFYQNLLLVFFPINFTLLELVVAAFSDSLDIFGEMRFFTKKKK